MRNKSCIGWVALLSGFGMWVFAQTGTLETNLIPGDGLLVKLTGLGGDLPEYREVVDKDGNIELPFLGLLSVSGKNIEAVQREMSAAYEASGVSTGVTAQITWMAHFDIAPARDRLQREDPRIPVRLEENEDGSLSLPIPSPAFNP